MLDAPLQFTPILVPKVWGGRRLEALGKTLPEGEAVGESWEIADLPGDGPTSVVSSGPLEGVSLRTLVETHHDALMGDAALSAEHRFPLLIKFLDACDNLSVQVHPDEQWAATHPDAFLKSEAWVIMDADPGSRIWAGVEPGTTAASMQAALDAGTLTECLQWRAAQVGACHTLPSGTCHALGTGVLVAEVQTTSDTTFRLWDWGRTGRAMHVPESLACIDFDTPPPDEVQPPPACEGLAETLLADTPWFVMRRVDTVEATNWRSDLGRAPMVLMCLSGTAHATGPGGAARLQVGSTALLPAAMEQASVELGPNASILVAQPRVA
ncbi:MAG: class I mannose-6-phosphate isomerase [Phycisphaerales bacterium]|jgi:mannose-6-phosphate isomerase|nr:class I mannose-6-phosphate isomerase [Phycisphaerales bacterium]